MKIHSTETSDTHSPEEEGERKELQAGVHAALSSGRVRVAKPKAVLSLDLDTVEWYEVQPDGRVLRGTAPISDQDLTSICAGALAAREAAGGHLSRCTIALGPSLAPLSRLALPPLKGKELEMVLTRRAMQSLGGGASDPRFYAQPLEGVAMGEIKGKQSVWLVTAFDAALLKGIVCELERVGITCMQSSSRILSGYVHAHRRFIEARQEPVVVQLPDAIEDDLPPERHETDEGAVGTQTLDGISPSREAQLTLLVEPQGFSVGLQEGSTLLHVDRINGDLHQDPGVAAAVIQDLRSLASFFRRESRGGQVTAVVVVGLASDSLALLSQSIKMALPDAEIISSPRDRWLEEASAPGRRHPRLYERRSSLTSGLIGATLVLALAAVGITWRVRDYGLEDYANASQDLEVVQSENRRLSSGMEIVEQLGAKLALAGKQLERMGSISRREIDLAGIVHNVAAILDTRAFVKGFSCRQDESQNTGIELDAITTRPALEAHGSLDEIRSKFEKLQGLESLALDLPVNLAGVDGTRQNKAPGGLEFKLTCDLGPQGRHGGQEEQL